MVDLRHAFDDEVKVKPSTLLKDALASTPRSRSSLRRCSRTPLRPCPGRGQAFDVHSDDHNFTWLSSLASVPPGVADPLGHLLAEAAHVGGHDAARYDQLHARLVLDQLGDAREKLLHGLR